MPLYSETVTLDTKEAQDVFAEFKTDLPVWKYMLKCVEIPRPSGHMDDIRAFLLKFAKDTGLESIVDKSGNVIIRKPGSKGCENLPGVCFQAHMDIVAERVDKSIDVTKTPVAPRIDGEYLKAVDSSLGGDDGTGIAVILAILESKDLKHPPLEGLFTWDEETGLFGAAALEAGILKSKFLVNVDSEEEYAICVGCAGGFTHKIDMPLERKAAAEHSPLRIRMEGFLGGHSGVDIDKHRENPLKVAGRLIRSLEGVTTPLLVDLLGGDKHNAIARETDLEIMVPAADLAKAKDTVTAEFKLIQAENRAKDPGLKLVLEDALKCQHAPLTAECTRKMADLISAYHYGPMRFSPACPGLVETSNHLAIVRVGETVAKFTGSGRSLSGSQLDMIRQLMTSLTRMIGVKAPEFEGAYPGWEPEMGSPLLAAAKKTAEKAFGRPPKIYTIHAGLECGLVQSKYPGMQAISVGPEIHFPHSPSEELLIGSLPRLMRLCEGMLEDLTN